MLIYVPLSQIDDNPFQRRVEYGNIEELAGRIAAARENYPNTRGLLQVPRGRLVNGDGQPMNWREAIAPKVPADGHELAVSADDLAGRGLRVQIAFGHRRLRAFGHLHKSGLPQYDDGRCPVHIDDLTDAQMLDAVWSENYDRKDISAVEQAELLKAKLEQMQASGGGGSQREVADAWGLARSTVANRLRLLELPAKVQQANREGRLSERQALALLPVLTLQAVQSTTKWKDDGSYWSPESPSAYIQTVLDNPDEATSDAIRKYAQIAMEYVGQELPRAIADFDFSDTYSEDLADRGKMVQDECKGCRFRSNNYCLARSCLDAKWAVYGRILAREAAAALGYPYSDNEADFEPYLQYSDDAIKRLAAIHQAGGCQHLVAGWWATGWGVRPFGDSEHGSSYVNFRTITNRGVVLGHRGDIRPECLAAAGAEPAETEILPGKDLVNEWEKSCRAQCRKIKAAVLDALAEEWSYALAVPETLTGLMALGGWPQYRNDDDKSDYDLMIKKLLSHMSRRGPLDSYLNDSAFSLYTSASEILAEAGLDPAGVLDTAVADTRVGVLVARCTRILYYWQQRRLRTYGNSMEHARQEIDTCRRIVEEVGILVDPQMATLSMWLDVAARDVAEKLARKQTDGGDDDDDDPYAEDDLEDETYACAGCGDELDIGDLIECACGAEVCEECYFQTHVIHDTSQDTADMREWWQAQEEETE